MFEQRAKGSAWRPEALHSSESERGRGAERVWRRGRQTIWFKEGGEEKETDLGLNFGEEGAGQKVRERKEKTERKKAERKRFKRSGGV